MVQDYPYTTNLRADLGTIRYVECLQIQRRLVRMRKDGAVGNILLFLEHPPTYTVGRKHDPNNYQGLNPIRTERGGDITFHGPGQLVSYMVFDTRVDGKRDVRRLLQNVESSVIEAAGKCGFRLHIGSEPGFWLEEKKVGSVGMALDDYVSYHGISLNYDPMVLEGFMKIRPCGLPPEVMSFIPLDLDLFKDTMEGILSSVYGPFRKVKAETILNMTSGYDADIPYSFDDTKTLV